MEQFPIIALRGLTILPGMIVHFDVTRGKSIAALEQAMAESQLVFAVTQKDSEIQEPEQKDLYEIGVIAKINQIIRVQKGKLRVVVTVQSRGQLIEITNTEGFLGGLVQPLPQLTCTDSIVDKAMMRALDSILVKYCEANQKFGKEALESIRLEKKAYPMILHIAGQLPFTHEQKQRVLEAEEVEFAYEIVTGMLLEEINVLELQKEFAARLKEKIDKNQKEYYLREQIKVARKELGEDDAATEGDEYLERLRKLQAPDFVKEKIEKEIVRFKRVSSSSYESAVSRGCIENLLELPWEKCSEDRTDIHLAKEILDSEHYGLEKVKDRILDFLAVKQYAKGEGISPILCLVGPPGTGKTSIAKSLAKSLNKEYVRICLGGVRDEAEIRGHRKTYVGAMSGRIVKSLKQAGVKNPLMLLDEIDKLGNDYKGDPAAALLEVLDSEQNSAFVDHYVEIPIDLSQVTFVATANSLQTIPRPLLDRMEVIEINSYTLVEKEHIANDYLIPKQREKHGLKKNQISIPKKSLRILIQNYTKEAGVRGLERKIGEICRKVVREILESDVKSVKITEEQLEKYLGKKKYLQEKRAQKSQVGIVRGLAWTSVGGDTLEIEVNVMPGKGGLKLTGQLGDVMKESAQTALSYVRSLSDKYKIDAEYFENHELHLHVPEGAVPKDGPSAGITMATAILSAVTDIPVRADIAMTGEITLRGRVLPIGGLKEKILAANMAGCKTVIVPDKNRPDVAEIPEEIKQGVEIIFAKDMGIVIQEAFRR